MKELYGIDITTVKTNTEFDSVSYETKAVPQDMHEAIDSAVTEAYGLDEKASLPVGLSIARWLSAAFIFVTLSGIIRNIGELSFAQMFNNAPWLFIAAFVLVVLWVVLTIIEHKKKKDLEASGVVEEVSDSVENAMEKSRKLLSIPDSAVSIDSFTYEYKIKGGEIKIHESMLGHFITVSNYIFVENGNLCIADAYSRFDIRLADIKGIDVIKKRMYMSEWIKDEPFTEGKYKDFLYPKEDNLGRIWLRSYCVMRFTLQGEEFSYRFPTYELETVQALTGIRAENAL